MLLFLATTAFATPHFGLMAGGGVIGGRADDGRSYSSFSPVFAGTVDWRFGFVETWLGLSGTGFVAPYGGEVVPAALLQGELGLGLGSPTLSGGVYIGAGLSGGEGGVYGRLMFPGPTWAPRLGAEFRGFHLGTTSASGMSLMLRAELGESHRPPRRPPGPPAGRPQPPPEPPPPPPEPPPEPPVQHDDPYEG